MTAVAWPKTFETPRERRGLHGLREEIAVPTPMRIRHGASARGERGEGSHSEANGRQRRGGALASLARRPEEVELATW